MKNLAAGFVLAFSFVAVRPAAAQEDVKRGSWQSVLALAPGAKVHVRRIDGAEQSGVIQKVSGDGIELTTKSAVVSMLRADVRAVEVPRKVRRRGRNLAIAAGIGAVVGAGALGGLTAAGTRSGAEEGYVELFATVGALVGAAVGTPLGLLAPDRETIFERRVKW